MNAKGKRAPGKRLLRNRACGAVGACKGGFGTAACLAGVFPAPQGGASAVALAARCAGGLLSAIRCCFVCWVQVRLAAQNAKQFAHARSPMHCCTHILRVSEWGAKISISAVRIGVRARHHNAFCENQRIFWPMSIQTQRAKNGHVALV